MTVVYLEYQLFLTDLMLIAFLIQRMIPQEEMKRLINLRNSLDKPFFFDLSIYKIILLISAFLTILLSFVVVSAANSLPSSVFYQDLIVFIYIELFFITTYLIYDFIKVGAVFKRIAGHFTWKPPKYWRPDRFWKTPRC